MVRRFWVVSFVTGFAVVVVGRGDGCNFVETLVEPMLALRCNGFFNFDIKLFVLLVGVMAAAAGGVVVVSFAGILDLAGDDGSDDVVTIGTSPLVGSSLTNVP